VKRAIISDIHSNLEALQAVLADIRDQGITKNCWKNAKYRVTGCRHDPLCQSGIMLQVNPVTPGAPQIESWLDSGWFKPASAVLPHPV
jgi:hypothetical protein